MLRSIKKLIQKEQKTQHYLHDPVNLDALAHHVLLVGQLVLGFVVGDGVSGKVLPVVLPALRVEELQPGVAGVLLVRLAGRVALVLCSIVHRWW